MFAVHNYLAKMLLFGRFSKFKPLQLVKKMELKGILAGNVL